MRLLVITYYWPPAGGPGVQRWLKTSKELKKKGVDVEILTLDENSATYPLKDVSLVLETENITVHKTKSINWFHSYQNITRRKEVPFSGFANQAGKPGPLQKISRFIRGNFFLPDPRKGWNRFAVKEAIILHAKKPYDAIITTGPPHSTHLIGKALKRRINCLWFADFRDPWTDIYYYRQFYPTFLARHYDNHLERSVLRKSDMIITVSNDLKRILNNKVPEVPKDKFLEIPNGYDPEDFSKTKTRSRNETFTLVYAGTLTLDYPVESLYSSLKIILNKSSNSLSLKIAGRPAEECVKYLYELSNRYSNFQFESLGYISHQKSVKLMESSDMLLLLIPDLPNNKGILTGKIFEYIGSGRPIWGFGPKDGDAQDILQECKAGELHDLPKSAAFALENHMNKAVEGASKIQRKKYTREGLAQKLLNQLLEKIDH
tara:strand:+ start:4763 stop:6058 length:1296 start_codon:yes stop_codon:yes gene_type:complete